HSSTNNVQSMHSSGSITRKLGPAWKQSTGHTSTQSVCLQLMQLSVTTCVIGSPCAPADRHSPYCSLPQCRRGGNDPGQGRGAAVAAQCPGLVSGLNRNAPSCANWAGRLRRYDDASRHDDGCTLIISPRCL